MGINIRDGYHFTASTNIDLEMDGMLRVFLILMIDKAGQLGNYLIVIHIIYPLFYNFAFREVTSD